MKKKQTSNITNMFNSDYSKSFLKLAMAIDYSLKKNKNMSIEEAVKKENELTQLVQSAWGEYSKIFGRSHQALDVGIKD